MADVGALIEAIEAHLSRHPAAADSAEGVARWWVGASGVDASPAEVEQVLALLVRRHRLRRVRFADGSTLYCGGDPPGAPPAWRM